MRRLAIFCVLGLVSGLGCGLLKPYPGGKDPAELFSNLGDDDVGGGIDPTRGGIPQSPLNDPAIDMSITAETPNEVVVASPGQPMLLSVEFVAANRNVVGGGIRFEGSDEVQWTLIDSLRGSAEGKIDFAYSIPDDICDGVPNLCHELTAELFAVAENGPPPNPPQDVDGDGEVDGTFVVSRPARPYYGRSVNGVADYVPDENGNPREYVRVVLRCASCESDTCRDLLGSECRICAQPAACQQVEELCFGPGRPKEGTNEADQFTAAFGRDGAIWGVAGICVEDEEGIVVADQLCNQFLAQVSDPNNNDNCLDDMGDTDGGTGTGG
jgi:hypothetical protein